LTLSLYTRKKGKETKKKHTKIYIRVCEKEIEGGGGFQALYICILLRIAVGGPTSIFEAKVKRRRRRNEAQHRR
jgi:hypothetical protein